MTGKRNYSPAQSTVLQNQSELTGPCTTVFQFSLGDSTDGPIGYCANIQAPTATEAMQRLEKLLPDNFEIRYQNPELLPSEYLLIYFNPGAISPSNIDD